MITFCTIMNNFVILEMQQKLKLHKLLYYTSNLRYNV